MCVAPLEKIVAIPEHRQAIAYAFSRLQSELSPKLTYHNYWHTKEDVLPSCQRIADLMGIDEDARALLAVSAAFHDIGFVESYKDHELVGISIITQVLPTFGYSEHDIELVTGMIRATRLPQSPQNLSEEILADADLAVLGRPDFLTRNGCYRQELANYGNEVQLKQWYEEQLTFLEMHVYFTPTAKMLHNSMKQQNIAQLKEKLQSLD